MDIYTLHKYNLSWCIQTALFASIETHGSCTAAATKSQGAQRVIHQICAAIPQQYIHKHILSMTTRYRAVDATQGECTKY